MNNETIAKKIIADSLKISVDEIDMDAPVSSFGDIDSLKFEVLILELEKHIGKKIDPIKLLSLRNGHDIVSLLGEPNKP